MVGFSSGGGGAGSSNSSSGSSRMQQALQVARFLPLAFILSMLLYAYIVLVDVHLRYGIFWRHRYFSSTLDLIITTALEGMTMWALLVAVFKSPGHPRAGIEGEEDEVGPGRREGYETRWMKQQRKREALSPQQFAIGGDEEEEEEEHGGEGGNQDEAPLLSSHTSNTADQSRDLGPLRDNRNTSVFGVDGPLSGLIPGNPQAPSRTGRAQLDDVLHTVEEGQQQQEEEEGNEDYGAAEGTTTAYLGGLQVKNTGTRRWCKQCNVEKPDRAHHCSSCGVCVLRMDHHCPWLASRCVGLRNHKAFFLFLTYTAALCLYGFQDMARTLVQYVTEENNGFETSPVTWAILLFICFIFGVALIPFAGYHLYLILRNRTTLESMEGAGRVRVQSPQSSDRQDVSVRLRRLTGTNSDAAEEEGVPQSESPTAASSRSASGAQQAEAWRRDEQLTREERRVLKKAGKLNIYNVGWRDNWYYLMGRNWKWWFVPLGEPESDGYSYLVHRPTLRELEKITREVRQQQGQRAAAAAGAGAGAGSRESAMDGLRQSLGNARGGRLPPVSSVRGQARVSSSSTNSSSSMGKDNRTGHQDDRKKGSTSKSAHGVMEWGERPKKDFLLYGVDSDEDEYGNHGS